VRRFFPALWEMLKLAYQNIKFRRQEAISKNNDDPFDGLY
jgi:hypothetical protein